MALLGVSDLYYNDYSWTVTSNDNPKITGKPDSTFLNREEGYEVLHFINYFAFKHDIKNKATGLKIERMIHDHLPGDIRSREKVEQWIRNNWQRY